MAEPLVIIGAGGFGREAADVVEAVNAVTTEARWDLLGVVDDEPSAVNLERLARRGIEYLGTSASLADLGSRPRYVVGIGAPHVRKLMAARLDAIGLDAAILVHPEASIGSQCSIGEGSVVLAGVRLTTNIRLGRHVHLNPNVTVGHDTVLEDFVSMNPGSSVSGDCVVGQGALIGVAAVVLNQLEVGTGAIVGGGACVVRDVDPGAVVAGVPAVPLVPRDSGTELS